MKRVTTLQFRSMCDDMWSVVFRMRDEGRTYKEIEEYKKQAIKELKEYEITDHEEYPELYERVII